MIDRTKQEVEERYTIANGYKHDAKVWRRRPASLFLFLRRQHFLVTNSLGTVTEIHPTTSSTRPPLHDLLYTTSSTRPPLHDLLYATSSTRPPLHDLLYTTSSTRPPLHDLLYTTSSTRPPLRDLLYATSSTRPPLRDLLYTLGTIVRWSMETPTPWCVSLESRLWPKRWSWERKPPSISPQSLRSRSNWSSRRFSTPPDLPTSSPLPSYWLV